MNTDDSAVKTLLGDLDFDPAQLKEKYLSERDKRVRTDGNDQYIEVTAEFSKYVDDPYVEQPIEREPLFDEVEVVIIGGGFGGLLTGARLREAGFDDIRVIEKASD
ncbi:MAG: NAD(P)-binding protein, partial [Pseudomonadales bacterium]|nr:NAD(P)-binding protein [Pseudomonadales bacterium]